MSEAVVVALCSFAATLLTGLAARLAAQANGYELEATGTI